MIRFMTMPSTLVHKKVSTGRSTPVQDCSRSFGFYDEFYGTIQCINQN